MMNAASASRSFYGVPLDVFPTSIDAGCQFSPLIPGGRELEQILPGSLLDIHIAAPFGTLERRYTLALALRALVPNGVLCVSGPKTKGGARIKKELIEFGCVVTEESRAHHRICTCLKPEAPRLIDEAIKQGAPRLLEGSGLWSQPGIFSWDRLDPGSSLLLRSLPAFSGKGADLGCGIGYLGSAVLSSPKVAGLTLIDTDRRAVQCAERNVQDKRAQILWMDIRSPSLVLHDLDFVVMNPPFHDAGLEDRDLGQTFIERAHAFLRPEGQCWLTANRHLPYERYLSVAFSDVTLVAEDGGFKIFRAVK